MKKLLSANFSRLGKSPAFWNLAALNFAIGAVTYCIVARNARNQGMGWLEFNAHAFFYLPMMYIALILAVFVSFFLGTDHADGTIRNKLIVGHARRDIYLSALVTTVFAGVCFLAAYALAVVLVGLPLAGRTVVSAVELQPWRLVNCVFVLAVYAALLTLVSMLDSQKARTLLFTLLVAAILTIAGMAAYNRLIEPEYIRQVWTQADGSFLIKDGMPNSRYLRGTMRTVYEWLTSSLPTGAVMFSLDREVCYDWKTTLLPLLEAAALTLLGIARFSKKDLK